MIRISALILFAALAALSQTGCCWHRPLFPRGCYPCFGFRLAAPVAPDPMFSGVPAPGFAAPLGPSADCPGCGGYSSAAPARVGPYGLSPHASEPLAHAPAPLPTTATGLPYGLPPQLAGLPVYPAGQPTTTSVAPPPTSTPLPAPMPTKDDKK